MLGLPVLPADASSGGAGLTPPAQSPAAPKAAAPPKLADVRCVANPTGPCVEAHRADRGGTVSLTGRSLAGASQVVFYSRKSRRDDALVPIQSSGPTRVLASVPPAAQSGPIAVIDAAGKRSARWSGLVVESPEEGLAALRPASTLSAVQIAVSQPHRIFFGGMQDALFNFRVTGDRPLDVQIDLLRLGDNVVVRSWQRKAVAPGMLQRLAWNGAARGRAQPEGRYAFRVTVPGAVGAAARSAPPAGGDESVTLIDNMFPIRGAHQLNMGAGRFGAARRGHVHQGQDVFAACGTPLVAARGGTVVYSGYHALAGYYVVIDGQGTGVDNAYMHLREPALVSAGARVYTGQPIGEVGDSGDAQGCHLHFEEWSAPGWYKGGRPFDPLPDLKRWDASS
jgi:murein DD-endopeptidase MepM/ murein hydrolase activator NlpD